MSRHGPARRDGDRRVGLVSLTWWRCCLRPRPGRSRDYEELWAGPSAGSSGGGPRSARAPSRSSLSGRCCRRRNLVLQCVGFSFDLGAQGFGVDVIDPARCHVGAAALESLGPSCRRCRGLGCLVHRRKLSGRATWRQASRLPWCQAEIRQELGGTCLERGGAWAASFRTSPKNPPSLI